MEGIFLRAISGVPGIVILGPVKLGYISAKFCTEMNNSTPLYSLPHKMLKAFLISGYSYQ